MEFEVISLFRYIVYIATFIYISVSLISARKYIKYSGSICGSTSKLEKLCLTSIILMALGFNPGRGLLHTIILDIVILILFIKSGKEHSRL